MGDNTNLLTLSKSAINAIKKPELVQKIIALKERLSWILIYQNRCNQISKLNDTISQLHCTNEKIRSELAVLKNINTKMEERIIKLEKNQAKSEQHSWRNNIELSGIPNLEKVLIDICHDSGLEVQPEDIEGCHRLPASRYRKQKAP